MTFLVHHGIGFKVSNIAAFYGAYLQRLPAALGDCKGHILPGAHSWLERLHRHPACSLGLLTGNMQAAAKIKLEYFGLWEYFEFGGFGDKHMNRNDVALQAVTAARALRNDATHHQMWAIGDTPHDITCARSQGLNVIAVATGGYSVEQLLVAGAR